MDHGRQDGNLLGQLRRFSADQVKFSIQDQEWAKGVVDSILKEKVLKLCQEESHLPIRNFEYTGSVYERLKTEDADVDVMVVLRTGRIEVVAEQAVPGYVHLKVKDESSPFYKYANSDGYLLPEKFRNAWFTSLIAKVVTKIQTKLSPAVTLKRKDHGPATQLDIIDNNKSKILSCDLVPSFQIGNNYYVAKPHPEHKQLWRQSFSIQEKSRLAKMDKGDQGCRHELLRIVKAIISRETTFGKLTTYHLKSAFLHYDESPRSWHRDRLADRFTEYLGRLLDALERKMLPNYWVPQMNLFQYIDPSTLENMEHRLRAIRDNSRNSLTKILQGELNILLFHTLRHNHQEAAGVTSPRSRTTSTAAITGKQCSPSFPP